MTTNSLFDLMALLESSELRDRVHEMVRGLDNISPEDCEAFEAELQTRFSELAQSLRDVCMDDDTTEAMGMLPWICLETRFEWMRYNLQMQYQSIFQGTAQPLLMARGAALLYLLETLELYLDSETAFIVQKIAADPLATVRSSIERTDRLFALMAAAGDGGRNAVDSLLIAQYQIGRHTNSPLIRQELNKAVASVAEKVGDALRVSVTDIEHALEGVVLRRMGGCALRVSLTQASPDSTLTLPSAVANGLLQIAGDWLEALSHSVSTCTPEARMATRRSPHITISASLTARGSHVALTLSDDGEGNVLFKADPRRWCVRDAKVRVTETPGSGSVIVADCSVASISEYMMLRVGADSTDAMVGVPVHRVGHIERRDASALALHGTRIITRGDGGTLPLIDLGAMLFQQAINSADATYVIVLPDGDEGQMMALRVRSVEGVCRGSLSQVPNVLEDAPLHGFVQSESHIIGVLDLERLADPDRVVDHMARAELVA